jgi:hypothetical protein
MRLRIEAHEVTPGERDALVKQQIVDPRFQAFLAWRRSLLFLVAIALIPLTALRFYDAFKEPMPQMLQMLVLLPAAAEGLLCIVCWYQLKKWTRWSTQRRALIWTWIVFMVVPFLVFLLPTDAIVNEMISAGGEEVDAIAAASVATAFKATLAVYALLTLAPKAVSLLAGTIRAGLVTKMLFAGAPGPGWLVVLATPIYALFVFTLLVVPYQLTGNGWFAVAMAGLAVAQIVNGRAGYALTRPMTHDEAVKIVGRARAIYLVAMLAFIGSLLAAVWPLASKIGASTIATTILSFETNVMILTLIGSDLLISGLAKAAVVANATHLDEEAEAQLAAFAK